MENDENQGQALYNIISWDFISRFIATKTIRMTFAKPIIKKSRMEK